MQINANGSTAQHYYNTIPGGAPGYPPGTTATPGPGGTHYHQLPGGHLQPQQMSHSPSPPNNTQQGYHKDERSQRQYTKLVRKLETRNLASNQTHLPQPKKNELNGNKRPQRNGTSSGGSVGGGASSVGTSDDGEESSSVPDDEEEQLMLEYLSNVESPLIKEIQPRTALITWEAPQLSAGTDVGLCKESDLR